MLMSMVQLQLSLAPLLKPSGRSAHHSPSSGATTKSPPGVRSAATPRGYATA